MVVLDFKGYNLFIMMLEYENVTTYLELWEVTPLLKPSGCHILFKYPLGTYNIL